MSDSDLIPKKAMFRIDEVANIFSVHVQTVRNWRNEGRINGSKISSQCLRFSREEVIRVLNTKKDNE